MSGLVPRPFGHEYLIHSPSSSLIVDAAYLICLSATLHSGSCRSGPHSSLEVLRMKYGKNVFFFFVCACVKRLPDFSILLSTI